MSDASSDRTFPATPKKRQDARRRGKIARSPELTGIVVLAAMAITLRVSLTHGVTGSCLYDVVSSVLKFNPHGEHFDAASLMQMLGRISLPVAALIMPPLLIGMVSGVGVSMAQVGLNVSMQPLVPDLERINPAAGLKRMVSARAGVELVRGVVKMTILGIICWSIVSSELPRLAQAGQLPLLSYLSVLGDLVWRIVVDCCAALLIIGVADYAYQRWDFEKSLKMTRHELKQEMRESDGDPLLKMRMRRLQRAASGNRMMQQVPKADVVITNPTHFAVAVKYDPTSMQAPRVLARGRDLMALRIKRCAEEHGIPTVENRELARSLYHEVGVDREIPAELYRAVAEVLAFVYKLKCESGAKANPGQNFQFAEDNSRN